MKRWSEWGWDTNAFWHTPEPRGPVNGFCPLMEQPVLHLPYHCARFVKEWQIAGGPFLPFIAIERSTSSPNIRPSTELNQAVTLDRTVEPYPVRNLASECRFE